MENIYVRHYRSSELYHHGIKGQKWGIRRYQNEDGSLTEEGRKRYGGNTARDRYTRGKAYNDERTKKYREDLSSLRKSSKTYQYLEKESQRLVDKYGLDADDGGGGDTTRFTEKQLEYAGKRYWDMQEQFESVDSMLDSQAWESANKFIKDKYGDVAISDINFYGDIKSGMTAVAMVAALGGLAIVKHKLLS